MKIFATILFAIIYTSSFAQIAHDTVYYDKYWKEISSSDYVFYRIITHADDKLNVEDHYRSGRIQMQGAYTSLAPKEVRDGHFIYYTESGVKTRDEYFKEGLKEGEGMSYDTTGHYTYKMHFKKGKLEDTLTGYYPSGALRRTEIYINDSLVSGNCYDEKGNNIAFIPRIVNLEYPGGDMAMMRFIQHHIKYRDFARKNDIQGHVLVSFILDTAGNVTEIGIKKSVHPLLDKAAIDVVRKLPKFKPSEYEGKIVPTNCILTVMFKLSSR